MPRDDTTWDQEVLRLILSQINERVDERVRLHFLRLRPKEPKPERTRVRFDFNRVCSPGSKIGGQEIGAVSASRSGAHYEAATREFSSDQVDARHPCELSL